MPWMSCLTFETCKYVAAYLKVHWERWVRRCLLTLTGMLWVSFEPYQCKFESCQYFAVYVTLPWERWVSKFVLTLTGMLWGEFWARPVLYDVFYYHLNVWWALKRLAWTHLLSGQSAGLSDEGLVRSADGFPVKERQKLFVIFPTSFTVISL